MPAMMTPMCRLLGKKTVLWALLTVMVLIPVGSMGAQPQNINYADCLSCHQGIEQISEHHDFACAACHLDPDKRKISRLETHQAMVRNPSAPDTVEQFCLPCHQEEIRTVQTSLHWTMAGIINQTRYLWGAQPAASPAVYGLGDQLTPLPEPDQSRYADAPALLVDDFLRRRCLRCHVHTTGARGRGLYRASGCAACHIPYTDEGTYQGNDQAVSRSEKGYPARHTFTARIPDAQCRHCHTPNRVGADYAGLYQHDYSDTFRSPRVNGALRPRLYGLDQHHLAQDIHAQQGLGCIDCHNRMDVMGDGKLYSYEMAVPKRTCTDCHGGFAPKRPVETGNVFQRPSGQFVLITKRGKKVHRIPQFSPQSPGHDIPAHARVRCSACHAQWSYQDYGLSVIREDVIADYKWYGRTAQGDPDLEALLETYVLNPDTVYPLSKDWISGLPGPGIWSVGWRFRRWEFMPLGMDHQGRITLLRPRYQYQVSYVDRLANVALDSVTPTRGDQTQQGWAFMPYVPHTVAPSGRACRSCHQNPVAAGVGVQGGATMDTVLTIPSPPAVEAMGLLAPDIRKRLLHPSLKWQKSQFKVRRSLYRALTADPGPGAP